MDSPEDVPFFAWGAEQVPHSSLPNLELLVGQTGTVSLQYGFPLLLPTAVSQQVRAVLLCAVVYSCFAKNHDRGAVFHSQQKQQLA
jgi:hypothetical protein